MAHPKRKHSKTRTRKGRTHKKLNTPDLVQCSHCGKLKALHCVCPYCGFYKDKEIFSPVKKEKPSKTK